MSKLSSDLRDTLKTQQQVTTFLVTLVSGRNNVRRPHLSLVQCNLELSTTLSQCLEGPYLHSDIALTALEVCMYDEEDLGRLGIICIFSLRLLMPASDHQRHCWCWRLLSRPVFVFTDPRPAQPRPGPGPILRGPRTDHSWVSLVTACRGGWRREGRVTPATHIWIIKYFSMELRTWRPTVINSCYQQRIRIKTAPR